MRMLENQQPEKTEMITPFDTEERSNLAHSLHGRFQDAASFKTQEKCQIVSHFDSPDKHHRANLPMTPLADNDDAISTCKKLDLTQLSLPMKPRVSMDCSHKVDASRPEGLGSQFDPSNFICTFKPEMKSPSIMRHCPSMLHLRPMVALLPHLPGRSELCCSELSSFLVQHTRKLKGQESS